MKVTAEIGGFSESVFFQKAYICPLFTSAIYSEVIANSTGKYVEVVLNVPANYSENGLKKGSLVFQAEKV